MKLFFSFPFIVMIPRSFSTIGPIDLLFQKLIENCLFKTVFSFYSGLLPQGKIVNVTWYKLNQDLSGLLVC